MEESLLLIFVQPLLLFIFTIILWSVQSFFILHFARKYIYPPLYKNKITEWFFAESSVLLHEFSHFFSAIFTGSTIDLSQSFVSSKAGRVTALHEESIGGWISRFVAASAPSFLLPLFFMIIFFILTQQQFDISAINVFSPPSTFSDIYNNYSVSFDEVFLPNLYNLLNFMFNIFNPITLLLIYLLIICSIAAGPSEGDWLSTFELFISPIPAFSLLFFLVLLSFLFSQFISILVPFSILLLFLFIVVLLGLFFAFLFSSFLSLLYKSIKKAIPVLILFIIIYSVLFYFFSSIVAFPFSALLSLALIYSNFQRSGR